MCQAFGIDRQAGASSLSYRLAQTESIPVDNDGGNQVELGHAVVWAFAGAIAEFALTADAQGVFQGVMGLARVQPDLGALAHVGPNVHIWTS